MKHQIITAALMFGLFSLAGNHWQAIGQEQPDFAQLMEKYGKPGPEHKRLAYFNGNWKAAAKFYMPGQKEPLVAQGKSERKWKFGERFLVEKFTSNIMGMPFEGKGTTGYNRFTKKYVATWFDNMSTQISYMEGNYDEKSKTYTFRYTTDDPIFGKGTRARDTIKILNDNEHVMEMFYKSAKGGDEFRLMEIHYTRMKDKKADGKSKDN